MAIAMLAGDDAAFTLQAWQTPGEVEMACNCCGSAMLIWTNADSLEVPRARGQADRFHCCGLGGIPEVVEFLEGT